MAIFSLLLKEVLGAGVKRPKVLVLNLSGIGCHSTSKMSAQSYSQGINQQICVRLLR